MRAPAQLDRAAVPADILAELRWRCLALPEVAEEPAWAGTRWSVGGKNFAHTRIKKFIHVKCQHRDVLRCSRRRDRIKH